MIKTVEIPSKTSRKVKFVPVLEVDSETGETSKRTYVEFNGALLIPITDAHRFNTSASSIHRYIENGQLIPYLKNGQIKTDKSKSRVYFDLYEYMEMEDF